MKAPVHILITIRKPELLAMALLVFQTLRRGFPTAPVYVWGNGLLLFQVEPVAAAVTAIGGQFRNLQPTCHDAWIEQLVMNQAQPFWICDSDMVFFDEVEWWFEPAEGELFAGRYEPTWHEPWTDSVHVERLHTCLQWFNPGTLRTAMASWLHQTIPHVFANAAMPLIRQHFIPRRGEKPLFYDSTAGMWHAGGGRKFTDRQNAAFEHLHCGSYSEEVGRVKELAGLPKVHEAILANPELARGIQKQQNEFYGRQAIVPAKRKAKV